jgi:hypothetical protein
LQFLIGSDTTAEGSAQATLASWAKLQAKLGGSNLDASLVWTQISTPSSPASGTNLAYFKSDDAFYIKNSAGSETKVGGVGVTNSYTAQTSTYSILTTDDVVTGDTSGGGFTVTLPAASGGTKVYTIQKTDSSFNALTVGKTGGDTIAGGSTTTLNTQNESIRVISDGVSNWVILDRKIPSIITAYTPTFVGFGTVSGVDIYWKRIGDSVFIYGRVTSGAVAASTWTMTLPSGTAKGPAGIAVVGKWWRNVATGAVIKQGVLTLSSGDTTVKMGIDDYTTATSPVTAANGSGYFASSNDMIFECLIPISGWNG